MPYSQTHAFLRLNDSFKQATIEAARNATSRDWVDYVLVDVFNYTLPFGHSFKDFSGTGQAPIIWGSEPSYIEMNIFYDDMSKNFG